MRFTSAAYNFGSGHKHTVIFTLFYCVFPDGSPVAWPTGSAVILGFGAEEGLTTTFTNINSFIIQAVILVDPRDFCSLITKNSVFAGT
jgi:hypothetical protein